MKLDKENIVVRKMIQNIIQNDLSVSGKIDNLILLFNHLEESEKKEHWIDKLNRTTSNPR